MRILADESVDRHVVDAARQRGFELEYVAELAPGSSDEAVLARARSGRAVLVTADRDFGALVFRRGEEAEGVVLIRLRGHSPGDNAEVVVKSLMQHRAQLEGAFTVIGAGSVRIRPLPR